MGPSRLKPVLWVLTVILWAAVLVSSAPSVKRNRKSPPYIHDESYNEHGESSEENDDQVQELVSCI